MDGNSAEVIPAVVAFVGQLAAIAAVSSGERVEARDGGDVVAAFVPATPAAKRGPAAAREVSVAGHRLVELRVPVAKSGREEVWLGERGPRGTTALWTGLVGTLDSDGEAQRALELSASGIELYETAGRVTRCDGAAARLFRQSWDFQARRFRAKPAFDLNGPGGGTALQARQGDAKMPAGRPVGAFFWTAASSAAGVTEARALAAPGALNDGEAGTSWTAGGPAGGRGEFVTARASAGAATIVGLRLRKHGHEAAPLRRVTVLLGAKPEQRFDVELVDEGPRNDAPYWVALPKPVTSSCVTVVVAEGGRPGAPVAISDIDVITDLDGPDGVTRLAEAVREGTDCESRVPLLAALGATAVAPVTAGLQRGPSPGRECLLDVAARLPDVAWKSDESALGTALVAALDRARPSEEKRVLTLLPRLTVPPVEPLTLALADSRRPDEERTRMARALAVLVESDAAKTALLDAVGREPPAVRAAVRTLVAQMKAPLAKKVREALAGTPREQHGRRADLVLILGTTLSREPDERAASIGLLHGGGDKSAEEDFEIAARKIEALGQLADMPAVKELTTIRDGSTNPVLRYLAARELAAAPPQLALGAVRAALDDADPRVRETAALALGRRLDRGSAGRLVAAAKQEPWPFVRRAEVTALGEMCAAGDLLVRADERDVPEVRRAALVGLARCRDPQAAPTLLRVLGRRAETADLRALAGRLLGTLGDPATAPKITEALARMRVESQADLALEGAVVGTMQTLVTLSKKDALGAALTLLPDERPVFRRAALDALGRVCDKVTGAKAIDAALKDADEGVAAAAHAAQRRCQSRP